MSERILRYMVMDTRDPKVRRYWTGHAWTFDPLRGIQSHCWDDDSADQYWNLYYAGCQVALVLVELSHTNGKTTVHDIQILEGEQYGQHN